LGAGGALFIGSIAGAFSTIGFTIVQPLLEERMNLFDTCGVHNLHGMPGVLGGIASVISAYFASELLYGDNIGDVFPAMATGRSASQQVCVQSNPSPNNHANATSPQLFFQILKNGPKHINTLTGCGSIICTCHHFVPCHSIGSFHRLHHQPGHSSPLSLSRSARRYYCIS
jgi:hypothetical protein